MPIPSVNCAFVLDDYRFRVRGSPHTIIHFLFFSLLSDLKFFLLRFGIRSTSTYSVQFSLLQSNSVYFVQFSPIRSIFSILVNFKEKMGICLFRQNFLAKYPIFETRGVNVRPNLRTRHEHDTGFFGLGLDLNGFGS